MTARKTKPPEREATRQVGLRVPTPTVVFAESQEPASWFRVCGQP
jgi:hypothetical protein